MPLNQSRHAPLTSIASAVDSRPDLSLPEPDENASVNGAPCNGWPGSPDTVQSPNSPYSPGMRSSLIMNKKAGSDLGLDGVVAGEIQMQSFQEGLPPPPPVSHSWKRIDRWSEDNYEELYDNLCEGCTQNDINELEHELDCSLPLEVRESLQCHDGQERGGRPTGIIFGCMLLDCEEIVQEWRNWRVVNEEYLTAPPNHHAHVMRGRHGASSSSSSLNRGAHGPNPLWRQELLDKQDSQPPKAIQTVYAHPGWIPLARDWGGNNIAVDLAPGPAGKWGQIIIFGRDYDCKYVIARSWAAFLATVADDIGSERVFVDEETQELKLREFKTANVEPPYLDVLRWRMDQKYGRRVPKKRPLNHLGVNTAGHSYTSPLGSPYGSPVEDRGRSAHRFPVPQAHSSNSRGAQGKLSPLSQVSEETVKPMSITTHLAETEKVDKLVEAPTPTLGNEEKPQILSPVSVLQKPSIEEDKENRREPLVDGLGMNGIEEMKSVTI